MSQILSSFGDWYELSHEQRMHGNYDCTVNGKCSGCGDCCSNRLPLSQKEINQIRKYIEKNNIVEQKHGLLVMATESIDMTCPFMDTNSKDHKCTIYPVRPQICREYTCVNKRFIPSAAVLDGKHHNVFVRETFFSKNKPKGK